MRTEGKRQKRQRRKFTPEFKAGAVRLVLEEGKSVSEVGRDLDVHVSVISQWVKQAMIDNGKGPRGALTTAEKQELAQLRKENRQLRIERDILKNGRRLVAHLSRRNRRRPIVPPPWTGQKRPKAIGSKPANG